MSLTENQLDRWRSHTCPVCGTQTVAMGEPYWIVLDKKVYVEAEGLCQQPTCKTNWIERFPVPEYAQRKTLVGGESIEQGRTEPSKPKSQWKLSKRSCVKRVGARPASRN